jgi:hypothetical protein
MSIIYTETKSDTDHRTEIDLGDGRHMTINITHEGIIMDVFGVQEDDSNGMVRDDLHLGTVGMMFDEWADWIIQFDKDRDVVWPDKAV